MIGSGKYINPALVVGGVWAGWKLVLAPLLETLNLKDTKEERAAKNLQQRIESLNVNKDYWDPNFFQKPPSGTTALLLTFKDVNILAKQIKDAAGVFNDNESRIYSAFRALRYKSQVSYLAYWFSRLYALDLYTWLKEKVLNDTELASVLQITEKLPYGFKNTVTGRISGIGDHHTYFEKIITAVEDGKQKWARSLYNSMNPSQQKKFWEWFETYGFYEAADQDESDYTDQLRSVLGASIGRTGDIEVIKAQKYPSPQHDATYYLVQLRSGKSEYKFGEVKGAFNYVNVQKLSANPFLTTGKDYKTWDEAIRHYKNPTVRTMILMAENIIKNL